MALKIRDTKITLIQRFTQEKENNRLDTDPQIHKSDSSSPPVQYLATEGEQPENTL